MIDGILSLYATNVVSFDLDPPLRYAGADTKRRAWREFFAARTGGDCLRRAALVLLSKAL